MINTLCYYSVYLLLKCNAIGIKTQTNQSINESII